MSTPIRKVLITECGRDWSNVRVVDDKIEPPAKDQVQIKVIYTGFNGSDINMRLGVYPLQPKAPLTPGYCLVGRVVSNGAGSNKFKAGDMVAALTVYGAEATLVNQPEKYLIPVPDGLDLKQVCGIILDWSTAYGMVSRAADVKKGQRVFIHGLSGAVGQALVSLCLLRGATVYGTASPRNHDALRTQGTHPYDYKKKDWIAEMQGLGGVHVVYDPLGFESWDESYSILSRGHDEGGILVGYGGNLQSLNDGPQRSVIWPTVKLLGRNLVAACGRKTSFYYISRDQKTFVPDVEKLMEMLGNGEITIPIKKVIDMEDVPETHRDWTSLSGMGCCVVKIGE